MHQSRSVAALLLAGSLVSAAAAAQTVTNQFEPTVGQPGKDVVWVPSPQVTVERMLDVAKITPQDFVMDLGSGDGRNIIAAARRGARALGVEYNPDMVTLSRRNAAEAGVGDRAQFVEGDMFEADISKASALILFLLPDNLVRLRDKFLNMRPGSRIVVNTFGIAEWDPDHREQIENCTSWCSVMLYIVPAKVAGTWQLADGELTLSQTYQMLSGSLTRGGTATPISEGRVRGNDVEFTVGGVRYTGTLASNGQLSGTDASGARWSARQAAAAAR
ncbi:MAG: class I SAM-dependent methyltransferase [Vicinamibacterales bacterium]